MRFDSFFAGGFECASQRRHDDHQLDLLAGTRHDRFAQADYEALRAHGLRTVRDGLRWHLIEQGPGRYDWSSFLPMLRAAGRAGVQPIWDLCHYGWPQGIDIWRPEFVDRFAAFAAAAARVVREHGDGVPVYCPVNEISFWSWAGGDARVMGPCTSGRGFELKVQLVRATIAAIGAVRAVDPRARFLLADPLIHAVARTPAEVPEAQAYSRAALDGWQMIAGRLWPGLGGDPSLLDLVGVNYYPHNQWYLDRTPLPPGDAAGRPLRELLRDAHAALQRPLYIAETGAEGVLRAPWLRHVCDEVAAARAAGVPVLGVCLYPVLDYPGWDDGRHCETGLLGHADDRGHRPVCESLDDELARQQARFGDARG